MKKLLLLVTLMLTISSYSQKVFYAKKAQSGVWKTNEWVFNSIQSTNLVITVHPNKIVFNDIANSVYTITKTISDKEGYTDGGEKYNIVSWEAIDEKGKNVIFIIMIFPDEITFSVMYNKNIFRYFIQKTNLDNL